MRSVPPAVAGGVMLGARTSLSALSAKRERGSSPTVKEGVALSVPPAVAGGLEIQVDGSADIRVRIERAARIIVTRSEMRSVPPTVAVAVVRASGRMKIAQAFKPGLTMNNENKSPL